MKKLNLIIFLFVALGLVFTSCNGNEPDNPGNETNNNSDSSNPDNGDVTGGGDTIPEGIPYTVEFPDGMFVDGDSVFAIIGSNYMGNGLFRNSVIIARAAIGEDGFTLYLPEEFDEKYLGNSEEVLFGEEMAGLFDVSDETALISSSLILAAVSGNKIVGIFTRGVNLEDEDADTGEFVYTHYVNKPHTIEGLFSMYGVKIASDIQFEKGWNDFSFKISTTEMRMDSNPSTECKWGFYSADEIGMGSASPLQQKYRSMIKK